MNTRRQLDMHSVLSRWGKNVQSGLQNLGSFFGLWTQDKKEEKRHIWTKKVSKKIKKGSFLSVTENLFDRKLKEGKISNQVEKYVKQVVFTDFIEGQESSSGLLEHGDLDVDVLECYNNLYDEDSSEEEQEDSRRVMKSDIDVSCNSDVEDSIFHVTSCKKKVTPSQTATYFMPSYMYDDITETTSEQKAETNVMRDINSSAQCSTIENGENITDDKEANFDKEVAFVTIVDGDENAGPKTLMSNSTSSVINMKNGHGSGKETSNPNLGPDKNTVPEIQHKGELFEAISQPEADQTKSCESMAMEDAWFQLSDSLVYGKDALKHYNLYVQIENKVRVHELEVARQKVKERLQWRIKHIEEIITKARAYYKKPSGKAEREWKELRQSIKQESKTSLKSQTNIRYKLANLHEHWPVFTFIISFLQLVAVAVLCGLGTLTSIGIEPQLQLRSGVVTFHGIETVHTWTKPNMWIGPSQRQLIALGAFYAPCVRDDYGLLLNAAKANYSQTDPLGCCELASRNSAATTTEYECEHFSHGAGTWKSQYVCSARPTGQNSILHNLKPCCIDLKGTCLLLTHAHCVFLGGIFHRSGKENCRQVNCLKEICKPGYVESDKDRPWLAVDPAQWWRLPLSLLFHQGILHVVLVVTVQLVLIRQIEKTIGWLRVLIIYCIGGLAGLLMASILTPYSPHVGSTGSLFSMFGLLMVELIHFWKVIKRPVREGLKLLAVLILSLLSGTIPQVDIYSILTGLVMGMLSACVLLPYIAVSKAHTLCRIILITSCTITIGIAYFVLLFSFYKVQTFESCLLCRLINCVPYTSTICADTDYEH